jgi:hypothetical protein
MKPCSHCGNLDPVVYEDALYCDNCNRLYPVYTRVYVLPDFHKRYADMRDLSTAITGELENHCATYPPSPELIAAYQWCKDMAEKYDEWGNA